MSILVKLLSRYSVFTLTFYSVLIAFLVLSPYGIWWLINEADYEALAMAVARIIWHREAVP